MFNYIINIDGMGNFTYDFEAIRFIRSQVFSSIREAQRFAKENLVPLVERFNDRYPWRFQGFDLVEDELVPRFYCPFTGEFLYVDTFVIERKEIHEYEL